MRIGIKWLGLFLILMAGSEDVRAQWSLDIESGVALSGYNDVQIPGNTGTRFSLSEELDSDPSFFWRLRLSRDIGQRHHLSLLIAPLRIDSDGRLDRNISFAGTDFPSDTNLKARYRFDSYRFTYRYGFYQNENIYAGVGVTAKIRDAEISLYGDGLEASKTNTGFVPLLNFMFAWQFNDRFGMLLKGDGLAAPQGRAEDFILAMHGDFIEKAQLKIGYRFLEGGADNDEVYNFTLVNYFVLGVTWEL